MVTSDASSVILPISARKADAGRWRAIVEIGPDTHAALSSFFSQVNGTTVSPDRGPVVAFDCRTSSLLSYRLHSSKPPSMPY